MRVTHDSFVRRGRLPIWEGAPVTTFDILLLGIALSADAFAVTVSNTFVYARERRRRLVLMPLFFGLFQALMPLVGYFLGGLAAQLIEAYAGLVTLIILGLIGTDMVKEGLGALRADEALDQGVADDGTIKRLKVSQVLFQAVATAIDAFAVGFSLRAQAVNLAFAVTVIGLTTFACCLVALFLGRRLGRLLGDRAEVAGGIVLILIGLKAFLGL